MYWNWWKHHWPGPNAARLTAALWVVLGTWLSADEVYDNSVNDLAYRFAPGPLEIGDEIRLAGTARIVTNFTFEYWGENASRPDFAGYVQARVRFYENDGEPATSGYPTPGTVLFDSGWFPIGPTTRATLIFEDFVTGSDVPLTRPVPEAFTWTVQFSGFGQGDTAGVDIFSPPVAGTNPADYWQLVPGSGWLLLTNAVPMNFAALIGASPLRLAISSHPGGLELDWPLIAQRYRLQSTASLQTPIFWDDVTNATVVISNQVKLILPPVAGQRFFRLHGGP